MHRLSLEGENSYRVNSRKDFVRNGILRQEDVSECFDFAYGMTFGGSGAHRDHRSGGQAHRHMGDVYRSISLRLWYLELTFVRVLQIQCEMEELDVD